jgi:hypothetical protein
MQLHAAVCMDRRMRVSLGVKWPFRLTDSNLKLKTGCSIYLKILEYRTSCSFMQQFLSLYIYVCMYVCTDDLTGSLILIDASQVYERVYILVPRP